MAQVVSFKEPHIELPLLNFFSLLLLGTAYQCRLLFLRKTVGLPRQSTILLLPETHDRTAIALPTSDVGMLSNFRIICRSPTCAASCSGLHVRSRGQGQRDRVSQCNVRRFRCRRSSGTVPSFVESLFSRHASPRTDVGTSAFAPRARGATSSVLVWEVCGWARRYPRATFASGTSFVSSPFRWHASSFSHDFGHRRATCAPRFVSRSLVPSCVASFSLRLRRGRTKVGSRLLRSILPIRLRLRCLVPSLPMAMSSVPCRSCPSCRTNHVQTLRRTHPSPWEFLLPSGREVDRDERERQARGWADEEGRTDARSAKKEDGTGGPTDVPSCTAVRRLVRPSLGHVGRIRLETNRPTTPGSPCLPPCNGWACFYRLLKDRPQEERAATKEITEPTCIHGASKRMACKTKLADPCVEKHSKP